MFDVKSWPELERSQSCADVLGFRFCCYVKGLKAHDLCHLSVFTRRFQQFLFRRDIQSE